MADAVLRKIYYDQSKAGSFGGIQRLYRAAHARNSRIRLRDVSEWLRRQPSYCLYKPVVRKFKSRRVEVSGPKEQFQVDLAEVHQIAKANKGIRYLLVAIDVFTKLAWVRGLKNKTSAEVAKAFESVLSEAGIPKFVMSDQGLEFAGAPFKQLLKKKGIKQFFLTNPDRKAPVAERFIRTLRGKIARFQEARDSDKYIDKLQSIVKGYNQDYHRSIKMRPIDVKKTNVPEVWNNLYGKTEETDPPRPKYRVNDRVRLARKKGLFGRGYVKQWTRELFTIKSCKLTNVPVYTVADRDGSLIDGFFYESELSLAK